MPRMAQNEMRAMRGMPLRVRSSEGLGLTLAPPATTNQCVANHLRNSVLAYAARCAVPRFEPCNQFLRTFARVAGDAAPGNVLEGDDASVVDDMLPRGALAPRGGFSQELNAAVHATVIAFDDFSF